jgi:DNA repair protein RecN (Recombination protein N)
MLSELRIQGLGVIDDATLELAPGLTVVTGETGAGKTMVVTGIALLTGARADTGRLRAGSGRLLVEGRWHLPAGAPARSRALEAGAVLDEDGALIVTRQVSQQGRSRASIGGVAVPVALLTELGEDLVALHGQADQRLLLTPARQREALDEFAAVTEPLAAYRSDFHRWRSIVAEHAELVGHARQRLAEAEALRQDLAEVAAAAPESGEDVARADEALRLANAEGLRGAAELAHAALLADEGVDVVTLVGQARKQLAAERANDAELARLDDRLAELGLLATDLATDLASYTASVETDPVRLNAVEERRAVLQALTRRHGPTVEAVLQWADEASARLLELDQTDDRIAELAAQADALVVTLGSRAAQISAGRQAGAGRFAEAVTSELHSLAMPNAKIQVVVEQRLDDEGLLLPDGRRVAFGPEGVDDVELVMAAHAGAPARPLAKAASGGELSRVMLAIEVVFAGADPTSTFVFDEVDAGVGGAAAVEVGRRLARLARTAQVLVVTHLAQVAAYADRQLLVRKADDGSVTVSGIQSVEAHDRVAELARMLGGDPESAAALAHAGELLQRAAAERGEP